MTAGKMNQLANAIPDEPDYGKVGREEYERVMAVRAETLGALRRYLRVKPDTCPGCYLGDDGPPLHDLGYGCEYGKGGEW